MLKLRQVEVLQGQGIAIADAVRQTGVTVPPSCRWRKQYGGVSRDQLKRPKEADEEKQRLRGAVSDLTLDKMLLTKPARDEGRTENHPANGSQPRTRQPR